jgi:hypothetical protein
MRCYPIATDTTLGGVVLLAFFLGIFTNSCTQRYKFRSGYEDVNELIHEQERLQDSLYLKAHLKNGEVALFFDTWKLSDDSASIQGQGSIYDINRKLIAKGEIEVVIDSAAIFETNKKLTKTESERIGALTFLAALDMIVTTICITNPKTCYGSCPTFYLKNSNDIHKADAELFSSAIAPSMEYTDIDFVGEAYSYGNEGDIHLTMKNEALETHCVRNLKLLAVPLEENEIAIQLADNTFCIGSGIHSPKNAIGPEGDILKQIVDDDDIERFSLANESLLNSKEELTIEFEELDIRKQYALELGFRQSLMTTYLIYSAIGYMGDEVSDFFGKIESDTIYNNSLKRGIKAALGGIDVLVWDQLDNQWNSIGVFYETGPIAINRQAILLDQILSPDLKLKILLNKGLWRIDFVRLVEIKKSVIPTELQAVNVSAENRKLVNKLNDLVDENKFMLSFPGESYRIDFNELRPGYYALFLEGRGYYIEWLRSQWIKEKNLYMLHLMFNHPYQYLKKVAGDYKNYERYMEEMFWKSRVCSTVL